MKENTQDHLIESLPFDQYSRQYIVSKLIDKSVRLLIKKDKLDIIDLGGHKGKTSDFQPDDNVTILDVFDENYANYIKGDATKIFFKDNSFDIACSFDVLEHIPRSKRQAFVNEALRISKFGVFLAMPIDADGVVSSAETRLNEFHKTLFSDDHKWLKEHIDYKIPNENEIKKLVKKGKAEYVAIQSNQVGDWQLLQMLLFTAARNPDITEDVNEINAWYNRNTLSLDVNTTTGYRTIFFISNNKENIKLVQAAIQQILQLNSAKARVTINEDTFDQFSKTLSRISRKYNALFERHQHASKTTKELVNEVDELKGQLVEFQTQIYDSFSWKITKPLRSLKRVINSLKMKRG